MADVKHTPGPSIYADPKAPHQELTAEQRAIMDAVPFLDAASVRRYTGPWGLSMQPGGGWIAVRTNFESPANTDRLPHRGEFRTEAQARAAIAKATGGAARATEGGAA